MACLTLHELFDLETELPASGARTQLLGRLDDGSDREWRATGFHHAGDHLVLELSLRHDLDAGDGVTWHEVMDEICEHAGSKADVDRTCRIMGTMNGGDDLLLAERAYRPSLETDAIVFVFVANDPMPN